MNFIAEYKKLQLRTPRLSMFQMKSENSEYCFNADGAKNCYLVANIVNNENCMYGRDFYDNKDCIDCDHIKGCTLCYGCLNCANCYNCDYLQDSLNCNDCRYGYLLKGCRDCIGCSGLTQKQFYIFNEPYSEMEYRERKKSLTDAEIVRRFEELKRKIPRVFALQVNAEDCTGNGIYHSKNVVESFDVNECQDSGYLLECKKVTDSWDISILEDAPMCYQVSSGHIMNNCNFCYFCVDCSNLEYCESMISSHDCFGCISLRRKQYYILNEGPYSKEEYFRKVTEIKDQLRRDGMYGQMWIPSCFPRGDTVAEWATM